MLFSSLKLLGAGIVALALIGSGVGKNAVSTALIIGTSWILSIKSQLFSYSILAFASVEAIALFAFMMACLICTLDSLITIFHVDLIDAMNQSTINIFPFVLSWLLVLWTLNIELALSKNVVLFVKKGGGVNFQVTSPETAENVEPCPSKDLLELPSLDGISDSKVKNPLEAIPIGKDAQSVAVCSITKDSQLYTVAVFPSIANLVFFSGIPRESLRNLIRTGTWWKGIYMFRFINNSIAWKHNPNINYSEVFSRYRSLPNTCGFRITRSQGSVANAPIGTIYDIVSASLYVKCSHLELWSALIKNGSHYCEYSGVTVTMLLSKHARGPRKQQKPKK